MNIELYADDADYPDYRTLSPVASRLTLPADKAAGNYGKAAFSRTQVPADNTDFAHILAHEATGSLKQRASQGKIMELQQQIASGTYKPNARRIVERILGYRQHIKGGQTPWNRFQFMPHLSMNSRRC